jgi:hypothetical protein
MEADVRVGLKQTVKRCRSGWPMLGVSERYPTASATNEIPPCNSFS